MHNAQKIWHTLWLALPADITVNAMHRQTSVWMDNERVHHFFSVLVGTSEHLVSQFSA